ncbi:hypothetical protein [Nitrobacter vulgaris]|uniref:Uncharacterized protein n=1 Tax=Nitrobacter vulgaris TaxID=29421 RepID=A0A1V4HZU7_NITVU|nr:hypothetical protein [Nitrobacter vulgaris]OPH83518.1 hypothetical protein B2M20_06250 [Nitrobacter vulgaris]
MSNHAGIFEAAQCARWIRPDAARFLAPGIDPRDVYPALQRKFNPDQPRVPAGNPDGGQWTDGGGGINERIFRLRRKCKRTGHLSGIRIKSRPWRLGG